MNFRSTRVMICLIVSCIFASPCFAAIYVDQNAPGPAHDGTTWDTALLTIQEGVDAATPGGDVWVADGTYVENVGMGEGVQLYGGFLGAEPGGYEDSLDQRDYVNNIATIDGNQSGSCVVMAVDARVDGFTITNGTGTLYNDLPRGGGFFCFDVGDGGVIANNAISGNSAWGGGGIYCKQNSSPLVGNNTITENWAEALGGGISCVASSPKVTDNTITHNSSASENYGGGGIYCEGSAALIFRNTITDNWAAYLGGGISCGWESSATIASNVITHNTADLNGGGVRVFWYTSAIVAGNVIADNEAQWDGGGIDCYWESPTIVTNNTITRNRAGNRGGGIRCDRDSPPTASNNVIVENSATEGGGIWCDGLAAALSHNDFWGNTPNDYDGCDPGEGDISADPVFVDPDGGNWHLSFGSPCIDAGTNYAPELPETDWEGEPRVYDGDGDEEEYGVYATADMGADEFVPFVAEAPDPQPEADGPLFGLSKAGFPAWVWFSIPIDPDSCCNGDDCYDPATVLGFPVSGHLWRWDKYNKFAEVYQAGFVEWDLAVGEGYLLFLWTEVPNPSYLGVSPFTPFTFEHKLGRQGWTWIGMPGLTELPGEDFMSSVKVKYPSDETGSYRTSQEDYEAIPDNWITWGWPFWNTWRQGAATFTPYAPFGHNTCYPWIGYRVWVKAGTAADPDDPDQVTLIWPKL